MSPVGTSTTVFQYTEEALKTTEEWFKTWSLVQKEKMKKDFLLEGVNLALRFKLASILNDAAKVSNSKDKGGLQILQQLHEGVLLEIVLSSMYFDQN